MQRALFTGATIFLDLMLMLVAMTFNLGLIICITLGYMLGALAFGERSRQGGVPHSCFCRRREHAAAWAAPAAARSAAHPLTVINQPSCCPIYPRRPPEGARAGRGVRGRRQGSTCITHQPIVHCWQHAADC